MSEQVVQPTFQYAEPQIVINSKVQSEDRSLPVKMNMRKYAWYIFRQFYEYNHRHAKLSTLPQIGEIEPTDNCNLQCRFCSREAIEEHRGLGFMPPKKFKYIVETYSERLISPILAMHGEPTVHPDLPRMIKLVKDHGAHSICIKTNGTLLDEDLFMKLVDAGLDGMEISFEGTDKTNYEYQRLGAKFDVTKKNILRMCELKTRYQLPIDLGINIIDNAITHDGLPEFIAYWSKVPGLNRVDTARIIDWAGTLDKSRFKELVREETYSHPFSKFNVCPIAWFKVGIDYNGWVVPCCHWLAEPMGNIFEEPLEAIWNGPKYIALRKLMLKKGRHAHDYCAKCWDGSERTDSPYFHRPNRAFPFTRRFSRNVKIFMRWSKQKQYAPMRGVP